MNNEALKATLKIAFRKAIADVGYSVFKGTSMFPLSNKRETEQADNKQAA